MAGPKKKTFNIPVNADVHCSDGRSGTSIMVVINPVSQKVTYVVVEYRSSRYLVPRQTIAATAPECIILDCTKSELVQMELFSDFRYVNFEVPQFSFHDEYVFEPYVHLESEVLIEEEKIPPGELAISRGNEVSASDGRIGTVDEFIVDRGTGDITHLVLREGHLWGKRDIAIPLREIKKTGANEILLKLSRKEVAKLPSMRVFRLWD